jgi:hypothetical protein
VAVAGAAVARAGAVAVAVVLLLLLMAAARVLAVAAALLLLLLLVVVVLVLLVLLLVLVLLLLVVLLVSMARATVTVLAGGRLLGRYSVCCSTSAPVYTVVPVHTIARHAPVWYIIGRAPCAMHYANSYYYLYAPHYPPPTPPPPHHTPAKCTVLRNVSATDCTAKARVSPQILHFCPNISVLYDCNETSRPCSTSAGEGEE